MKGKILIGTKENAEDFDEHVNRLSKEINDIIKTDDRFKPLRELTKEQRKETYDFAMKCSDEILSGLGIKDKQLDKICSVCDGNGRVVYDEYCSNCDGRRYELTEEGKMLVEFIERHFKIEKR